MRARTVLIRGGLRVVATLIACGACFGFSIGTSHSWVYAVRSAIKVPILLLFTATVCSPAYYVVARFLTSRLHFVDVQRLTLVTFRDLAVLLASLSPITLFLGETIVRPDEFGLGEYPLLLGVSMLFIAIAGSLMLVLQARRLLSRHDLTRSRANAIVTCWLALSLLVGGQGAFCLRPLFGLTPPGEDAPFALMNETTVTGAHNFFEVVYQLFDPPELERGYNRRRPK